MQFVQHVLRCGIDLFEVASDHGSTRIVAQWPIRELYQTSRQRRNEIGNPEFTSSQVVERCRNAPRGVRHAAVSNRGAKFNSFPSTDPSRVGQQPPSQRQLSRLERPQ
jgi:hypothetical protein